MDFNAWWETLPAVVAAKKPNPHPVTRDAVIIGKPYAQEAWKHLAAKLTEMEAENAGLKRGMKGDYDLDAWLDWTYEAEALRNELAALRESHQKLCNAVRSQSHPPGDFLSYWELARDLMDVCRERDKLRESMRRIPVGERLPKSEVTVIAFNTYHDIAPVGPAKYVQGKWLDLEVIDRYGDYEELLCVTHWMPLPTSLKQEQPND